MSKKITSTFGSKERPLRPSALPNLMLCDLKVVSIMYGDIEDNSGKAADTGSATHRAAAAWHTNGRKKKESLAVMQANFSEYPLADLDEAERFFDRYIQDPRNQIDLWKCEQKVECTIPPAKEDPTGEMIVVQGTLDQIRINNGRLEVWDIKTGNRPVGYMANFYAYQIFAYVLCAEQTFGKPVDFGGFIRTKGYFTRGANLPSPDGVFLESSLSRKDIPTMTRLVQRKVAAVRNGEITHSQGDHCDFCPYGGVSSCLRSNFLKG